LGGLGIHLQQLRTGRRAICSHCLRRLGQAQARHCTRDHLCQQHPEAAAEAARGWGWGWGREELRLRLWLRVRVRVRVRVQVQHRGMEREEFRYG
jgi:hypothetical protein